MSDDETHSGQPAEEQQHAAESDSSPDAQADGTENQPSASAANGLPEIEDANAPDAPTDTDLEEDDLELLTPDARSLKTEASQEEVDAEDVAAADSHALRTAEKDDTSDTDSEGEDPATSHDPATPKPATSIDCERSARPVIIELKRIETEVRNLLGSRDTRRKRKLAGTRRWLELEEDLVAWRASGRYDGATVSRLHELVRKRHYLFNHLRFVAGTRPTWNT